MHTPEKKSKNKIVGLLNNGGWWGVILIPFTIWILYEMTGCINNNHDSFMRSIDCQNYKTITNIPTMYIHDKCYRAEGTKLIEVDIINSGK